MSAISASWVLRRFMMVVVTCFFLGAFAYVDTVNGQGWSELSIRLLDDAAFAVVEVAEGGKKVKHCPHHDHNGRLDYEQLIYVLGTIDAEVWISSRNRVTAKQHLDRHYSAFIKRARKAALKDKVNINTARLTELVRLPHIGPFLAVKMVQHRDRISRFGSLEELRRIEGIGSETFNAIRHYLKL